jgi:hypothetical protein
MVPLDIFRLYPFFMLFQIPHSSYWLTDYNLNLRHVDSAQQTRGSTLNLEDCKLPEFDIHMGNNVRCHL